MSIHIKNGTPLEGPSLCESCSRSHVVKGYRQNEQLVVCQALYPERRVRFPVRDCSNYAHKGRLTLRQMEEIAWTLMPRGPKRKAGFATPGASTDEKESDQPTFELVIDENE